MSLGAVRGKEEPACAMTEEGTIKEEQELNETEWVKNEAEYVPPMCVQVTGDQLEPAHTKQEPLCAPGVGGELQPVYTELETVCFKDELISVKEEPSCQFDQEFKYEIPVEPGLPPAETPNVKGTKWDCFVRLERLVVPRGAALRFERASQRRERPRARLAKRGLKHTRPLNCKFCKERFSWPSNLSRHVVSHRAHKQRQSGITNVCTGCEMKKALNQLVRLLRSELAQTSENTDLCEPCNK